MVKEYLCLFLGSKSFRLNTTGLEDDLTPTRVSTVVNQSLGARMSSVDLPDFVSFEEASFSLAQQICSSVCARVCMLA